FPPGPDNPGHSLVLYRQQLLNYVQYFTWQFGRDWLPGIGRGLAVLFGALGLLGARRHWRADRRAAVAMTTLILTLTVALVFYLNFKWGYSQAFSGTGLEHEVRERDYFFIASFAPCGERRDEEIVALAHLVLQPRSAERGWSTRCASATISSSRRSPHGACGWGWASRL